MSHEHGLAAKDSFKMAASEVASFKMNFFRKAGISEAETLVSGKAKCSLAIGEDKKSKLFGTVEELVESNTMNVNKKMSNRKTKPSQWQQHASKQAKLVNTNYESLKKSL